MQCDCCCLWATEKLHVCLTLCSCSVSVHSDLRSKRLLMPSLPMYPCPSVITPLLLALGATPTPVLISRCMSCQSSSRARPLLPLPLIPLKASLCAFGGFSRSVLARDSLSPILVAQRPGRVANSDQSQTRFKHLFCILSSLILKSSLDVSLSVLLSSQDPSHSFIGSQQNNDNETPLHCAAQYGHSRVVRLLLEELTDPTMRNNKFETPLDLAALYGRLEVVRLLLTAHPNLLGCNTKKHTPLHLASRNGHLPVVEVLLDAGMDINYEVCARIYFFLLLYLYVLTYLFEPKSFVLQMFLNILSWPKSCWAT